ncbi:histidinol phosphatase [Pedobacter lusitanus]|uniref:protein-tyrosine-phosphatase n=1 Tax=Pedobacter lusitanus TaxID=1503925 RepID=A0A0D0GST2_9SPHI|nr:CpsB/CapC family capsule biosynthesis tyrosine phosphatase [Pedobacter lusitanus]KIO77536.1 histidinol phosphatase [Pedobacter lusitanus]
MFTFFKKKNRVEDIEWLGIDVHSHLLPGIDDGAPDLVQSLDLIRGLNNLGFSKFLCTPHIFAELYPNNPDTIKTALLEVKAGLQGAGLDVVLDAAAEYMVDENFRVADDLLCLPGKYVLIEMSYLSETPGIEQVIFDLKIRGYHVILAHPERYSFNHADPLRFSRYKEIGVLFQLNLLSVCGYYGKEVKQIAEYLLENELYDLAATDLHHNRHLRALSTAVTSGFLHKRLGNYGFKNKELFS